MQGSGLKGLGEGRVSGGTGVISSGGTGGRVRDGVREDRSVRYR